MSTDGQGNEELSQQESLDEDNLRVDPLEKGIEPPERWAEADRFGTTPREQREGEDHEHRLAEEEPDVPLATRPGAETPLSRLDDRIDEPSYDLDEVIPGERVDPGLSSNGRTVDEAGQSVAEALREEPEIDIDAGDLAEDAAVRGELR
ncbi:hypothetical protein ACOBQX_06245 [Actinokineospora sp. G85]|uniref:hypothetical protein n=1 Tax=Actinokineospora sp. G85 TaxID=3406626 RepID=UPI003C77C66C